MNAKEAREIIKQAKIMDWCHNDPNVLFLWHKADGYLECLREDEEVKELVGAFHRLIEEVKTADNAHAYDNLIPAIEALMKYRKAIK